MFSSGEYDYTKLKSNSYNLSYELPDVLKNKVHPRLIIEKDKIETIKQNLTHPQNIDRYKRLVEASEKNYSDCSLDISKSNNHNYDYLSYIEANAFLYALGKDTLHAQKAVKGIKEYLATYRAQFSNLAESREAGNLVFRASLVYDWCYDNLTDEDKNYIINECLLLFCASEHGRDGLYALNAYNSDHGEEYVLIKNMLGFAVAAFDEIPYYFNNVCKRIVEEFVPSRNFRYENSDFNQMGDNYGIFRSGADSFLKLILKNLGRDDLLTQNQSKQAYQAIYRKNPNGDFMRDGDCYSLPILGGYQVPSGYTALLFIQSLMSSDSYLKGEYYKVTANLNSNSLADSFISDAMHLALNDVSVFPKQKNDLPLSKYFGDKSGVMVARTSWDDGINSNTMTVSMKVSENNMGSHGHSDSGHFYIYYKGPLAVDSGVYEPISGNKSMHLNNYYRQTVAHNSVLIGGKGQKRISGIDTYSKMSTGTQFGEVLGYDFGKDLNKPDYTYLKGDLTKAYDGAAEEYTRSFMFFNFFDEIYPGALIVFDKITSTSEDDKKTYLLHSQNEPEISGNTITIKNTTDYGYNGRLINKTLLPKSDVNIDKISGYVVGENDYTVGKAHKTGIGDESGNYRVEISSSVPEKTEYILNVLQVSENDDSIEALPSELIETDGFYGVKIKDRIALFSKNRDRSAESTEFEIFSESKQKICVCDLKEGTWNVYKDGTLYDTVTVSENGGVAYFEGDGGAYSLSYASSDGAYKDMNFLNNLKDNPDYISTYRKNIKLTKSGTTVSNFVYMKNKPFLSDEKIMLSPRSVSEVFGIGYEEDNDTARMKNGSDELVIYKNSKLVTYNNNCYLSSADSHTQNGSLYSESDVIGLITKCEIDYNHLNETVYFTPTTSVENTLTPFGNSADVLKECIFAKADIVVNSDSQKANGSITVYNHTGNTHEFRVYLAVYSGGKLKSLDVSKTRLVCESDKTSVEFDTPWAGYTQGDELKLFVWKNDGITPMLVNKSKKVS